jgi:hypothetical protein
MHLGEVEGSRQPLSVEDPDGRPFSPDAVVVKQPYWMGEQAVSVALIGLGACMLLVWFSSGSVLIALGATVVAVAVAGSVAMFVRGLGITNTVWAFDDSRWYLKDELHPHGASISWSEIDRIDAGARAEMVVRCRTGGAHVVPMDRVRRGAARVLVDELVSRLGVERIAPSVLTLGSDPSLAPPGVQLVQTWSLSSTAFGLVVTVIALAIAWAIAGR